MKQTLIDELKNFFNVKKEDGLIALAKESKIRSIVGLEDFIISLHDEATSPKEIAQRLEHVVVCILIKRNNATDLEQSLKNILESYQERLLTDESEFQERISYSSKR